MKKDYKFEVESFKKINKGDYNEEEFAVGRLGFLSNRPNSHGLQISEEVLRECAKSAIGKWLVADMSKIIDATTHTDNQNIFGYIPVNQEVEFIYDEDNYLRAYLDVVISKIYSRQFLDMFEDDNYRSVSVEMRCVTDENDVVHSFNIMGVTVLGRAFNPSCENSDIVITRFSEKEATSYYARFSANFCSDLDTFLKGRKEIMVEKKTYKIDKSKEAMSNDSWGDINKVSLRNKVVEAANAKTLVKSVYLLVEEGWEDTPSEKLKYPVMQLKNNTFVYNRNALASAKAYAEQHEENSVITKLNKIYKSLDLDDSEEKEGEEKLAEEIKFAAVDIGDMWSKIWDAIHDKNHWDYSVEGVYEEDNKKFAILRDRDGKHYRLNFTYTEDGMTLADEIIETEFVLTESIKAFAEPENIAEYRFADDAEEDEKQEEQEEKLEEEDPVKMSYEELEAKVEALVKDCEDKDAIIMEKDAQIEELCKFKAEVEDEKKSLAIDSCLAEVQSFLSTEQLSELRNEAKEFKFDELSGWKNKVKAIAFENNKKSNKPRNNVWGFAAPTDIDHKKSSDSVWDRL